MIFTISFAENFEIKTESYINDIPFKTEYIVKEYLSNKAFAEVFAVEEESYIDDIPFNTVQIALNHSVKLFKLLTDNQTLTGLY